MDRNKKQIAFLLRIIPDRIVETAGGRWVDRLQRRATIDLVLLRHSAPPQHAAAAALSSTNSSCS